MILKDNDPNSENNMYISIRLKSLIKEHEKITEKEFAERLKISYTYINKILNHKKVPSVQLLELICKTYHINSKWLKEGVGEIYEDKNFIEYQKVFDKFKCLNPTFKHLTLKFMDLLIDSQNWDSKS